MKTTRHDEATCVKADKRNEKRERKRCLMIFCCGPLVAFVIIAITIALIFVLLINKEKDPKAIEVTCQTGWTARNDSRSCYLFSNDKKDWTGAQSECLKLGGSLTDIETSNELCFVNHQVKIRTLGNWIGGTDTGTEGTFRWEPSGKPFSVTGWHLGEPNNLNNNENCVNYYRLRGTTLWNDAPCSAKINYICEMKVKQLNHQRCL